MMMLLTCLLWLGGPSLAAPDEAPPDLEAGPDDTPIVEQIEEERRPVEFLCRRLVGLTGGLFEPGRTWQFTGPVGLAGSPVLAMSCDVGGPRTFTASLEVLPLYVTREIGSSEGRRQWLNVSLGTLLDNEGRLRMGPLATVGWKRVGAGARVLHLPFGPRDLPTGFEYRLQAFYNGGIEVQASVAYTLTTNRYPR